MSSMPVVGRALLLLQVDIEGHSTWLRHSQSKPGAVMARIEAADRLSDVATRHGFDRVFWAGDGGLFARDASGLPDQDCLVAAGEDCLTEFERWRRVAPDRAQLELRVSAHSAYPVYTYHDPGQWTSDHLNLFIKHERRIGVAGTVAITDAVKENLSPSLQPKFPDSSRREVLIGAVGGTSTSSLIRFVYYMPIARTKDRPGTTLRNHVAELTLSVGGAEPTQADDLGLHWLGGASLLAGAFMPSTRLVVDLERVASTDPLETFVDQERETVLSHREQIRGWQSQRGVQDRTVLSVDRLVMPLLDVPCLTLQWHPETWSTPRAFHQAVGTDSALWERAATQVSNSGSAELRFPGNLTVHVAITLTHGDKPYVLLCQRSPIGPVHRYHLGLWSCSIEEQMEPGETVDEAMRRSVAEELLGPGSADVTDVSVLGAILERDNLNLGIVGLCRLPLQFDHIVERWRSEAPDRDEHAQIVAVPLDRALLSDLASGHLYNAVRERGLIRDWTTFGQTNQWEPHPTSLIRAAAALWATGDMA
jgi:hypothetical protein